MVKSKTHLLTPPPTNLCQSSNTNTVKPMFVVTSIKQPTCIKQPEDSCPKNSVITGMTAHCLAKIALKQFAAMFSMHQVHMLSMSKIVKETFFRNVHLVVFCVFIYLFISFVGGGNQGDRVRKVGERGLKLEKNNQYIIGNSYLWELTFKLALDKPRP